MAARTNYGDASATSGGVTATQRCDRRQPPDASHALRTESERGQHASSASDDPPTYGIDANDIVSPETATHSPTHRAQPTQGRDPAGIGFHVASGFIDAGCGHDLLFSMSVGPDHRTVQHRGRRPAANKRAA
jgi:hypothetical protein